jgi:hypothetical protein
MPADTGRALAGGAALGNDLVVQTPYGDSGKTTFFIAGPGDWERHGEHLRGEDVKVMRRVNCQAAATEAVNRGRLPRRSQHRGADHRGAADRHLADG